MNTNSSSVHRYLSNTKVLVVRDVVGGCLAKNKIRINLTFRRHSKSLAAVQCSASSENSRGITVQILEALPANFRRISRDHTPSHTNQMMQNRLISMAGHHKCLFPSTFLLAHDLFFSCRIAHYPAHTSRAPEHSLLMCRHVEVSFLL
jgi:hypothetical protein